MSNTRRRVYWDTSLFLSFLNKAEQENRRACEEMLRRARDGEIEIYTSFWTVVEVIRPKWIPAPIPLTDEQVELIKGMFQWEWLRKVQVHQTVAFAAADLARRYKLKPADSIHAATAILKKVDVFYAFDRDFSAISGLLNVERPKYVSPLPLIRASEEAIGPTPEKLQGMSTPEQAEMISAAATSASAASNAPQQPVSQSLADGTPKGAEPLQGHPSGRPAVQAPPPPDSSPTAPPPSQSKK